jgi:hypothetical protein
MLGSGIALEENTMQRYFIWANALLLLALLGLSCSRELSPVAPVPEPEKPILSGVQRLQGYWKVVSGPSFAKYFIADTMISHFVTLEDVGSNFHYVFDQQVQFTDSTILGYNSPTPLYNYGFSAQSDTLVISNAQYGYKYLAVVDTGRVRVNQWAPTITYEHKSWFSSNANSNINGVDRYGNYWYFREIGYKSSTIDVRDLSGQTVKSYTLPGVTSVDISGGYLWIAGPYYVEQRNLEDTTLIRHIDLTSQYTFQQGEQLNPLAVKDSLIFVVDWDRLLCFDLTGRFIREMPTYEGIFAMKFIGNTLVAGTDLSSVNTIDISTGNSINSYLLPDALQEGPYGEEIIPIEGIVDLGDHIGAFRQSTDTYYLYLYEFTFPQ